MEINNNIKIIINEMEIPLEQIEDTDIEIKYGQEIFIDACTINGSGANNFYSAYKGDIFLAEFEVESNSKANLYFKQAFDNHTPIQMNFGHN